MLAQGHPVVVRASLAVISSVRRACSKLGRKKASGLGLGSVGISCCAGLAKWRMIALQLTMMFLQLLPRLSLVLVSSDPTKPDVDVLVLSSVCSRRPGGWSTQAFLCRQLGAPRLPHRLHLSSTYRNLYEPICLPQRLARRRRCGERSEFPNGGSSRCLGSGCRLCGPICSALNNFHVLTKQITSWRMDPTYS